MAFELMEPIEGSSHPTCSHCGKTHDVLPMEAWLAVGFGSCNATKDDECIYDENSKEVHDRGYPYTLQELEEKCAADPDHDYRLNFYGPLRESYYQRQGPGHWVLYKEGQGFA